MSVFLIAFFKKKKYVEKVPKSRQTFYISVRSGYPKSCWSKFWFGSNQLQNILSFIPRGKTWLMLHIATDFRCVENKHLPSLKVICSNQKMDGWKLEDYIMVHFAGPVHFQMFVAVGFRDFQPQHPLHSWYWSVFHMWAGSSWGVKEWGFLSYFTDPKLWLEDHGTNWMTYKVGPGSSYKLRKNNRINGPE